MTPSNFSIRNAFLIICFVSVFAPSIAQQEKGDTQFQGSLSLTSAEGSDLSLNYQAQYSGFLTKNAELGLGYSGNISGDNSFQYLSPFFNYNFLMKDGKFVFYLGAQYLFLTSSTKTTETSTGGIGAKAGIRAYINPTVFYYVGPNYTSLDGNSQFDLTAGIGVLFKKTKKAE